MPTVWVASLSLSHTHTHTHTHSSLYLYLYLSLSFSLSSLDVDLHKQGHARGSQGGAVGRASATRLPILHRVPPPSKPPTLTSRPSKQTSHLRWQIPPKTVAVKVNQRSENHRFGLDSTPDSSSGLAPLHARLQGWPGTCVSIPESIPSIREQRPYLAIHSPPLPNSMNGELNRVTGAIYSPPIGT